MGADDSLPDDVITLKAMLRAERAARLAAEAEAQARTLLIEKLTITKLRHEQFGQSSERAVAFKRSGDPNIGNFADATILKTFGDMPANLDEL